MVLIYHELTKTLNRAGGVAVITMDIKGVSFRLKEYQNFEWLETLGTVFCAFDEQDSGGCRRAFKACDTHVSRFGESEFDKTSKPL